MFFDGLWTLVLDLEQKRWWTAPRGSRKRCLHCYLNWLDFMAALVPIHSFNDWMTSTFVIVGVLAGLATIPDIQQWAVDVDDLERVFHHISRRCAVWPCTPVRVNGSVLANNVRAKHPGDLAASMKDTLKNMCFISAMVPLKASTSVRKSVI